MGRAVDSLASTCEVLIEGEQIFVVAADEPGLGRSLRAAVGSLKRDGFAALTIVEPDDVDRIAESARPGALICGAGVTGALATSRLQARR